MSNKSNKRPQKAGKDDKVVVVYKPWVLQPDTSLSGSLGPNNPKVGEFACLCLFGPMGNVQYTVCRPIGFTDLEADDWTMIPTDQVSKALARIKDPKAGAVNKKVNAARMTLLVDAKLLVLMSKDGQNTVYYPSDKDGTPRNEYLGDAERAQKTHYGELREMQKAFTKKTPATDKDEVKRALSAVGNLIPYLDEKVQSDEKAVRKHLTGSSVKAELAEVAKTDYRTLIGPFGDKPQVAMTKMKGLPLVDVMAKMHKRMLEKLLDDEE